MKNQKRWKEFLDNTMTNAMEDYKSTKEYEYFKQIKDHIDEILTTNLPDDDKDMVNEILFELGVATRHEKGFLYQQGMKDCVWILKNLGVLS